MNIIFDLDGTLALINHRRHFVEGEKKDWDAFFQACLKDEPNIPIIKLAHELHDAGNSIEIWSGRSDVVKKETVFWLAYYVLDRFKLKMRPKGDFTPDDVLKEQWLNESPQEFKDNLIVFDDRDKVVAMWRRRGITCCQVAEGDF